MTFISYAQNAEDVLLWRSLKHVSNGFYIDVGANDPQDDSVTKAFYDRGWHGINIEPLSKHHACLQMQRSRDINLQVAAGNYNGELTLFDIPNVRGWATSDPDVANQYRQQGLELTQTEVSVRRLDSICAEFAVEDIHFLKIDVEGCELEVLQGMNFQKWRPWILVIEAIRPNSQDSFYERFEPLLLECQYQYAYSDGLNRYYVAQEHLSLAVVLALQPNVFDDYQFIGYQRTEEELQSALQQTVDLYAQVLNLDSRLQLSYQEFAELQELTHDLNLRLESSEQAILAIKSSLSWRVTHPLRELNFQIGKLRLKCSRLVSAILRSIPKGILIYLRRSFELIQPLNMHLHQHEEIIYQGELSPRATSAYIELQNILKERNS